MFGDSRGTGEKLTSDWLLAGRATGPFWKRQAPRTVQLEGEVVVEPRFVESIDALAYRSGSDQRELGDQMSDWYHWLELRQSNAELPSTTVTGFKCKEPWE
jgi:hypothetical protein